MQSGGCLHPLVPSLFRESFLQQVGKAVRFKAHVPFTLGRRLLLDTVRGAGYDLNKLPVHWRSRKGSPAEKATRKVLELSVGLSQENPPLIHQAGLHPWVDQWMLTDQGLVEAQRLSQISPPPPSPKELFDPLLRALGKAVGFKAGKYVSPSDVIEEVVRSMGYDPDNLSQYGRPEDGWQMGGWTKLNGFICRIHYACRNGRAPRKIPLTLKGPNKGEWGLTEAGVEYARKLCGMSLRNVTSEFLGQRLKATGGINGSFWRLLRSAISTKLPKSAAAGIVDDHIHNCMVRLISRDSLRERVLGGKDIPDTLLATYAVRASFSDIRDMGTNPVTREMFGARTESERAKGVVTAPLTDSRIIWSKGDEGSPASIVDMVGDPLANGGAGSVEEYMDFQRYMHRLEDVIRAKKPKAGDRYLGVLRMKVSGFTIPEIAEEEGVSVFRAASMVAEARRCLQEARGWVFA